MEQEMKKTICMQKIGIKGKRKIELKSKRNRIMKEMMQ